MGTKDARESLKDAKKLAEGKGFMGWLTKIFMGKSSAREMAATIGEAEQHLDVLELRNRILASGVPAKATVLQIQDTGVVVNFDPIVVLSLRVQPATGAAFDVTARALVSKVAIPRVNDVVDIKYNPQNTSEFAVASPA